jgi:hypothetical protein
MMTQEKFPKTIKIGKLIKLNFLLLFNIIYADLKNASNNLEYFRLISSFETFVIYIFQSGHQGILNQHTNICVFYTHLIFLHDIFWII